MGQYQYQNNEAAVRTCENYCKTGHIKLLLSLVYVIKY